jgi:hypothetical protein
MVADKSRIGVCGPISDIAGLAFTSFDRRRRAGLPFLQVF